MPRSDPHAHVSRVAVNVRSPRVHAVGIAVAALGLLAGPSPDLEPSHDSTLGPSISDTGEGPTGYEVTFRYDAPRESAVAIVGDVYFTDPSHIGADMSHDARTGDQWRTGDVPHALMTQRPLALEQGSDGVWEITMALPSGVHSYGFVTGECEAAAFCEPTFDPANPPVFADAPAASAQSLSQLYVPEHPEYDTYESTHQAPSQDSDTAGEVRHVTYPSQQSSRARGEHPLGVYLPPGWNPERADPYPLLVLSHGAYDNETSWFSQGAAADILDHAIADGAMEPAIVVTTLFDDLSTAEMGEPEFFDAYARELRESVLPFVERVFHASGDRAERSFGGLSMGGALGLDLLAEHPDLFANYGLWSAAADLGADSVAALADDELDRMTRAQAIHMGTGVHDGLQGIAERSQERAALYSKLGLPVMTHDVDGGHSWHVWREELDHYLRSAAFGELEPNAEVASERHWERTAILLVALALAGAAVVVVRRGS